MQKKNEKVFTANVAGSFSKIRNLPSYHHTDKIIFQSFHLFTGVTNSWICQPRFEVLLSIWTNYLEILI